jgi:hypothetical protein
MPLTSFREVLIMVPLHLDLPEDLAAIVAQRAAAHGTTPETYTLALIQQVVLQDALGNSPGRRKQRLVNALRDDVLSPVRQRTEH